jgi:hypothetical protein
MQMYGLYGQLASVPVMYVIPSHVGISNAQLRIMVFVVVLVALSLYF